MARNRNRDSDQDERPGRLPQDAADGVDGEPILPIVDDDEGDMPISGNNRPPGVEPDAPFVAHVAGDTRYARDEDPDREHQERELTEDRELTDDERLELFRLALFQNQLPPLPDIPGFHTCWLTTTNPRDSIQGRIRLGYKLIKAEELPGWEHALVGTGLYSGCIGVNEMVAAKLPLRLYEMYMTEAHHNQPLAEEGKLRATLDAIKSGVDKRSALIEEEATAQLGTRTRRPKFEGVPIRRPA